MPLMGVGWSRPSAAESAARVADSAKPEPFEGQPRQFSPEQICLEVGRNRARARFAWADTLCAKSFVETVGGFFEAGRAVSF